MSYAQSHVQVWLTVSEAKALAVAAEYRPGVPEPPFANGHVRQAAVRGYDKLTSAIAEHQRRGTG